MIYTTLYALSTTATFCLFMTFGVDKKVPANTRAGELGGVAFAALLFPVSIILFFAEGYHKG